MLSTLYAVVACLAVLTLLNLLLLFAVIRRLRELESATSPVAEVPRIGTSLESFETRLYDGTSLTNKDLLDHNTLLVFLSSSCPPCRRLATQITESVQEFQDAVVFVVCEGGQSECTGMAESLSRKSRVAVVAADSPELHILGEISGFPTVVLLGNGRVSAAGARLEDVGYASSSAP